MKQATEIIFFNNGNTCAFDNEGNQISELQRGWMRMYVEFLISQGIDPFPIIFSMPDRRRYRVFKTEAGYNCGYEDTVRLCNLAMSQERKQ